MKPVDVKDNTYIDSSKNDNDKNPDFKVGDHVRVPNTKTVLLKDTLQTGQKKFLWLKKLKTLFHRHVISDLKGEEIAGTFYEIQLPKVDQQTFRIEKVIKKKSDKLYVKWKLYNSSYNNWIE